MILILSDDQFQTSMDDVILWLSSMNANYTRLNGFDYLQQSNLHIDFENDYISINDCLIDFKNINVIWHFRFGSKETPKIGFTLVDKLEGSENNILLTLSKQNDIISEYFFNKIGNKKWFNIPSDSIVNKLQVLNEAKKIGLKIPKTIISKNKDQLKKFIVDNNENVITKPIWEVFSFSGEDTLYSSYTSKVFSTDPYFQDDGDCLPTLLQESIDKKFEIRTFFIDGRFFSMAIFSQENDQTKGDFRVYDRNRPNRTIPYKLPTEIENKLENLLSLLNLKTSSIDIIYSILGEFVFLEVNPVGQFGMTSHPCNYYLEKEIALTLMKYDSK